MKYHLYAIQKNVEYSIIILMFWFLLLINTKKKIKNAVITALSKWQSTMQYENLPFCMDSGFYNGQIN